MDGRIKLDIFGKEIKINPESSIITLEKYNEEVVSLVSTNQGGECTDIPIFTVRDYGKTADEFIKEFDKQNFHAYQDSKNKK